MTTHYQELNYVVTVELNDDTMHTADWVYVEIDKGIAMVANEKSSYFREKTNGEMERER
jgi:hypothetical protein